jgi:hypothetical protein
VFPFIDELQISAVHLGGWYYCVNRSKVQGRFCMEVKVA